MSVYDLHWNELDPRHAVHAPDELREVLRAFLSKRLPEYASDVEGIEKSARHRLPLLQEQWKVLAEITDIVTDHCGAWAEGWQYSGGEGDGSGGVVSNWCCPNHSWTSNPDAFAELVVQSLCEWRTFIEQLADLFAEIARSVEDRMTVVESSVSPAVSEGITRVVSFVADCTGCNDAWYDYAQQSVAWLLEFLGLEPESAVQKARNALSGKFESWIRPSDESISNVNEQLGIELAIWLGERRPNDA